MKLFLHSQKEAGNNFSIRDQNCTNFFVFDAPTEIYECQISFTVLSWNKKGDKKRELRSYSHIDVMCNILSEGQIQGNLASANSTSNIDSPCVRVFHDWLHFKINPPLSTTMEVSANPSDLTANNFLLGFILSCNSYQNKLIDCIYGDRVGNIPIAYPRDVPQWKLGERGITKRFFWALLIF